MTDHSLTLYVMSFHIKHKEDTLGGPMLMIVLTFMFEEGHEFINFKSGNLNAKIGKSGNFSMNFFYNNVYLTGSNLKSLSYITSENGKLLFENN